MLMNLYTSIVIDMAIDIFILLNINKTVEATWWTFCELNDMLAMHPDSRTKLNSNAIHCFSVRMVHLLDTCLKIVWYFIFTSDKFFFSSAYRKDT